MPTVESSRRSQSTNNEHFKIRRLYAIESILTGWSGRSSFRTVHSKENVRFYDATRVLIILSPPITALVIVFFFYLTFDTVKGGSANVPLHLMSQESLKIEDIIIIKKSESICIGTHCE